jgi:uncharacterized protein YceK
MRNIVFALSVVLTLSACSNKKKLTDNLHGTWYVYKYLKDGIDKTAVAPYSDSIRNYTIEFTSGGDFKETNVFAPDTVILPGKWAFEDNNETLTLTDTVYKSRSYTIFNLEGNHVELRRLGTNRYLRKQQ